MRVTVRMPVYTCVCLICLRVCVRVCVCVPPCAHVSGHFQIDTFRHGIYAGVTVYSSVVTRTLKYYILIQSAIVTHPLMRILSPLMRHDDKYIHCTAAPSREHEPRWTLGLELRRRDREIHEKDKADEGILQISASWCLPNPGLPPPRATTVLG